MSYIIYSIYEGLSYYNKYLRYKSALIFKLLQHNYDPKTTPWWDQITEYIILGAIPLKNYNHDNTLIHEEKVKYILTILDTFEIETETYLSYPIKPVIWEENQIDQKIINSHDFEALRIEDLEAGVLYIENCIKIIKENNNDNSKIYVHCKSGHGRSACVVIAYLMKNNGMDVASAHTFVKDKRNAVNLGQSQYNSLVMYSSIINK